MPVHKVVVALCLLGLALPAASRPADGEHGKVVQAVRLQTPPRIDGRLDDACWRDIQPASGFFQFDPDNGRPASEATLLRVAYDQHRVYFAFHMKDSQPQRIWAELTPRNDYENNDSVQLILDTYNDRRTSVSFTVNARGVQKNSVETIWKSAAQVVSDGWTAEMAIPFKSLRFSARPDQAWGINVARFIHRLNETDYWTDARRDLPLLQQMGELRGLEGVKPGANLEFFPYAGVRSSRWDGEKDDKVAVGLDVKYGILPNLILDATVSPDFSEVQSDPFLYQLSPYENYFEENRPFFSEGSQYFRLSGMNGGMYGPSTSLFYSRRIDSPTFAAKLSGKTDGWSFGVLGALNEAPGDDSFFSVVRVQKDILRNSQVGFYYAGVDSRDSGNHNLALDYSLNFGEINYLTGMSAFTFENGRSGGGNAIHTLHFSHEPDDGLQLSADFRHFGRQAGVRTGYVSQVDLQSWSALLGNAWRLQRGFVRRFSTDLQADLRYDNSGRKTGDNLTWMAFLRCLSQFNVHGQVSAGRSRYQVFGGGAGLVWTEEFIRTRSASLEATWERGGFFKEVGLELRLERQGVYDDAFTRVEPGKEFSLDAELVLRPRSNIELGAEIGWVRQTLDRTGETVFDGLTYEGALHLQLTRSLFFNGRLLGETRDDQYSLDLLLGCYFGAGNMVQLSYKNSERGLAGLHQAGHSITLKVSYLLRI